MTDAERFEKYGCVLVKNFIDEQTISVVSQYFENKIRRGEWKNGNGDLTSSFAYYADPLIEVLLQTSKDAIKNIIKKEIVPTYSFSRIYQSGEQLTPHVDRPQCEISATINVANSGTPSPIYTKYKNKKAEKHNLVPGDALIYMGCDVTHWRQPLKNEQLTVQFMLHYVKKYGPNAKYLMDKRPALGFDSIARSE